MNNKYGISGIGTVSIWNQENDQGRLGIDNRGKRKNQREIEDIDILKILCSSDGNPLSATQIKKYVHWYGITTNVFKRN